jgi:4-aminobutyrate aminotransferase/(S)-3-amino-2-methylpropionate transaminase
MNDAFERLVTLVPGPRSRALATSLAATEVRGVTFLAPNYPIFWESGDGATITDVDGNRYLDLTGAFGVALTGHGNPAVARAIAAQAARLAHGMGDVHPTEVKVRLLERLASLFPAAGAKSFLCSTGAESIEFALKTAMLVTGEPNVLAFAGGYHGLSYAALEVGGIPKFRKPWQRQLRGTTSFVRFPDPREPKAMERALEVVAKTLRKDRTIGAVIVEPILGRAGIRVPPEGFLKGLRAICSERDTLLVVDEIYTGFGRTGTMFACQRENVQPDVLCVGKALGGGFPISAAIAGREIADAWAPSDGEALHTSTYLGNPMGCAAALANLDEIERLDVPALARSRESHLAERLHELKRIDTQIAEVRGRGLLWALEFKNPAFARACVVAALGRGLVLLQSGLRGEALALAPPAVISDVQLERALDILAMVVRDPVLA